VLALAFARPEDSTGLLVTLSPLIYTLRVFSGQTC